MTLNMSPNYTVRCRSCFAMICICGVILFQSSFVPSAQLHITLPPPTTDVDFLPYSDNKAHLLQSCRMMPWRYSLRQASFHPLIMTDNISYYHVWKCGGTLIDTVLKTLHSNHYIDQLHEPEGHLFFTLSVSYLRARLYDLGDEDRMRFTYIRDPVDRFISAYYEVKRRHKNKRKGVLRTVLQDVPDNDTEADLTQMRWILKEIKEYQKYVRVQWDYAVVDMHFWPQMLYLTDSYGAPFKFNYVGSVNNISITLPQILQKYQGIPEQTVKETIDQIMHGGASRSRKFDERYTDKRYVTTKDLNSEDLQMIRDAYWLDYECLFPEL